MEKIFTIHKVKKNISLPNMFINGFENDQPGRLWAKDMNKQVIVKEIKGL